MTDETLETEITDGKVHKRKITVEIKAPGHRKGDFEKIRNAVTEILNE